MFKRFLSYFCCIVLCTMFIGGCAQNDTSASSYQDTGIKNSEVLSSDELNETEVKSSEDTSTETSVSISVDTPVDSSFDASVDSSAEIKDEEPVIETEKKPEKYFSFADNDEFMKFLCDEWKYVYDITPYCEGASLTLNADGSFSYRISETGEEIGGSYKCDYYFNESDKYPDALIFESLDGTQIGRYAIDMFMGLEDKYYMNLQCLDDDYGFLGSNFNDFSPLLTKESEFSSMEADSVEGEEFWGYLWYTDFSNAQVTRYISKISDEYDVKPCAGYHMQDESIDKIPESVNNKDSYLVYVKTDDMGKIISMDFLLDAEGNPVSLYKHGDEKIAGYVLRKYDFSDLYSTEIYDIKAFVIIPEFIGNDAYVSGLNEKLMAVKEDYEKTVESDLPNYFAGYVLSDEYREEFLFQPISTDSVYYDDEGNASVGMSWDWYMGGVFNRGYIGVNYNYLTGQDIEIFHALNTSMNTAVKKLNKAVKDYCECPYDIEESILLGCAYWFDKDNLYLGFDSYFLQPYVNTNSDILVVCNRK